MHLILITCPDCGLSCRKAGGDHNDWCPADCDLNGGHMYIEDEEPDEFGYLTTRCTYCDDEQSR